MDRFVSPRMEGSMSCSIISLRSRPSYFDSVTGEGASQYKPPCIHSSAMYNIIYYRVDETAGCSLSRLQLLVSHTLYYKNNKGS